NTTKCRFYANEFPDVKDTVVVKVKEIIDIGVYVTLPEYNDKEGLIPLSELSRRRIRSAKQLIGVGWKVCVVVTRVDNDTLLPGCTLSKRRVDPKDLLQCEDRFSRAKAIDIVLRHVAEQLGYETNEQLEKLYEKTVWYFDRKAKKKAAAYDTFKKALTDPTVFDECDNGNDVKAKLLEGIQTKLAHQE
ncbi:Protein Y37E3.10, partial [Aphelenchoides avenae]